MTTKPAASPRIFKDATKPEWGVAVLLEQREGKMVLGFEDGSRRTFKLGQAPNMVELSDTPEAERRALDARVRKVAVAKPVKKAGAKRGVAKRASSAHSTFEAQVAWFEGKFPGGFLAEPFTKDERGLLEAKGKKSYKEGAIKLAQEQLSPEKFAAGDSAQLFASALKVLQATNIVFPQEGSIPFAAIPEEKRPALLEALRNLLHGEGEYGARLEQFVAAVNMVDKEGKAREVTWPLATLFGALYAPEQHVCVKPVAFASQAATLQKNVDTSKPVTGAKYAALLGLAKSVQERLVAAGLQPRDLMDVYSFIYRSQEAKAPAVAAVPAAS